MGLKSIGFLPELESLPGDQRDKSFREKIEALRAGEPALQAAEAAAAVSLALWGVWDQVNVPDALLHAYEAQYPGLAGGRSLHEQWQAVQADGADAAGGMLSGLKGKLAEPQAAEMLEQGGYSDVEIAASPVQQTWDISAVNDAGEPVFFQVKTGAEGYAGDVASDIAGSGNIDFLVSSEIAARIREVAPANADGIIDIGPDYELVGDVRDGLETLADNEGIDLPDSLGEALPYAVGGSDRFSGASRKRVVKPLASASLAMRLRRTVLPVPLSPTIIRLFAASRPRIRSRAMAASSRSSSRPANSGGGVPAPGA